MSSLINKNKSFDCCVKGLKCKYHIRLPSWPEGDEVYWNQEQNELYYISISSEITLPWCPTGEEIMRNDWEILG